MLHILIPMAGAGSRFAKAGYELPKPLIPVHGVPMIRLVIGNIRPSCKHRFIFIVQNAHMQRYALRQKLEEWAPGCEIIGINGITEGAACTCLTAREYIDNDDPLMIANSDQYVDTDIDAYLRNGGDADGLVMTMRAHDSKWSFIDVDTNGYVSRIVEKEVISNEATVGIYNFAHGRDFVAAVDDMIHQNLRVNNEFYVAPVYNLLIAQDKKIAWHNIGSVGHGMHGLGTPDDLNAFLELPLSRKVAEALA